MQRIGPLPSIQRRWDGRICRGRTIDLVEEWLGTLTYHCHCDLVPLGPEIEICLREVEGGRPSLPFSGQTEDMASPKSTKKDLMSSQPGRGSQEPGIVFRAFPTLSYLTFTAS